MRSIGPAVTREQSPAFLRNSNGRLDFPGPTQEASWIPRRNSRIPPQLEKNHVVPPSSKDEALSRYSVSGEAHVRNWRSKRYLAPLMRPHKVPRGNGNPLQYSCLGNPMDRGAWWAVVYGSWRVGHDWMTNIHTHGTIIKWRQQLE